MVVDSGVIPTGLRQSTGIPSRHLINMDQKRSRYEIVDLHQRG
ncbi:hypothetical Protein YC6258_00477 [Gynuella sunshinyii YC6258]|uniref:Uncharacterized protein n=1 Tax=Gynuella sunshinyii YC6258 TaxID=1445510 RepID=A0A0C5VDA9_9GAMM|nr:hypothetical Protein YC6258_00477 [Gynuella sunshinyii YC6258]